MSISDMGGRKERTNPETDFNPLEPPPEVEMGIPT